MASPQYKLTYFNVKGLAEPIRFIFAVSGVDYEDVRIEKESWPEMKKTMPWGQLPILEFEDKKLSQSNAIIRYLSRKLGLYGADDWEAAKIDEVGEALMDLRTEWRKYFFESDEGKKEELKKSLLNEAVPKYLSKLEEIKKSNEGSFLVGSKVSWADLIYANFFETLENTTDAAVLDPYPNMKQHKQAVFNIPEIKAWTDKRPQTQF